MFIVMQITGALLAVAVGAFLYPDVVASDLVVPHDSATEEQGVTR